MLVRTAIDTGNSMKCHIRKFKNTVVGGVSHPTLRMNLISFKLPTPDYSNTQPVMSFAIRAARSPIASTSRSAVRTVFTSAVWRAEAPAGPSLEKSAEVLQSSLESMASRAAASLGSANRSGNLQRGEYRRRSHLSKLRSTSCRIRC